tara:strand:+ start:524 stop:649 length:126 start_codon:yes stop_codon:yes gene_type:complete
MNYDGAESQHDNAHAVKFNKRLGTKGVKYETRCFYDAITSA